MILDLTPRLDHLTTFAAKNGSNSPYCKFIVRAALLTQDGKIIKGAGVESASYGMSVVFEPADDGGLIRYII